MVNILITITHGFALRMLNQTGILLDLSKSYDNVYLVVDDVNDPNLSNFKKKNLIKNDFNQSILLKIFNYLSKYFSDFETNICLQEKHYIRCQKSFLTKITAEITKFMVLILKKSRWIVDIKDKLIKISLNNYRIQKLLKDNKINTVLCTYPVMFPEDAFTHNAKMLNIKTVCHLLSWDNLTAKGEFNSLSEFFIVWGDIMKEELISKYKVPGKKIFYGGIPHFDIHSIKVIPEDSEYTKFKKKKFKKYIFFAMSSPRFAPAEIEIIEYLSDLLKNNYKNIGLVLRPHPQNVSGNYGDSKKILKKLKLLENSENIFINYPKMIENSKIMWSINNKDIYTQSYFLRNSILVLNSGSTISIEASSLGIPTIITAFDGSLSLNFWKSARRLVEYIHLKKLISFESVGVAKSYYELNNLINKFITHNNIFKAKQLNLYKKYCHFNGSSSTENTLKSYKYIVEKL